MAARIHDGQVRNLFRLLNADQNLSAAALKTGMDRKTARRFRDMRKLPSAIVHERDWRTREDVFSDVWAQVEEHLEREPKLQAKTLFAWLQREHPGRFQDGQLRTLQRRVKMWRATRGPAKEVFFSQVHHPARLCASDFTHMGSLGVTINGQPFDHLLYHFVLTYSNWESVTVCFSESFESLSDGLQNALWELDGVPERHRSDRLSSAVNNLSDTKEFTRRYQALMDHHGLVMEKTQAGKGNENGDVEASHGHFKNAVDQALLLRGSRDFDSREEYERFLQSEVRQPRNAGRQQRLQEELPLLRPLPKQRLESCKRLEVTVDSGSLIHVNENTYSVNSRLMGERVEVRIYAEHLEVWYGQRQVEKLPRLRGRQKHRIDYRHVIDTLVRKPGAFANYRYRSELFPTSRFRMAYDALANASRRDAEYLKILHLAARTSETLVDDALRVLLAEEREISHAAVEAFVRREQEAPPVTDVSVVLTELASFDELLSPSLLSQHKEVNDEQGQDPVEDDRQDNADEQISVARQNSEREDGVDRLSEGAALADDSAAVRGPGPTSGEGGALLRALSAGAEPNRMRSTPSQTHRTPAAREPHSPGEEPGELRSEASTQQGDTPVSDAPGWDVCGSPRECPGFRRHGFGQTSAKPILRWSHRFSKVKSRLMIPPILFSVAS